MTTLDNYVVERKNGYVISHKVSGDLSHSYDVVPQENYRSDGYSNWTTVNSLSDARQVIEEAKQKGYSETQKKWTEKIRNIDYRFGYLPKEEAKPYLKYAYGEYAESLKKEKTKKDLEIMKQTAKKINIARKQQGFELHHFKDNNGKGWFRESSRHSQAARKGYVSRYKKRKGY